MGHAPVNGKALPIFLALTSIVPIGAGLYRIGALAVEWDWALKFSAQHVDNLPLFLHAIFALTFIGLGALQLLPGFRARHMTWHRAAGRWTATAGILAALTGIWMTLAHQELSTPVLFYGRLIFSSLWAIFILIAVQKVIQKDIRNHRAYMIRAFSIAITAGTLPFIYIPVLVIFGEPAPLIDNTIQVAGWIINLSIAEWIIRHKPSLRTSAVVA